VSRARDVAFTVASVLFGAMWLFAAAAKIAAPLTAYEFVARVVPPGLPAKTALVVAIAAETLLGAAMALRAVGAARGFSLSLLGLAVACVALVRVQMHAKVGEIVQCGCYGDAFAGTLVDELVRNGVMAGVLGVLLAWGLLDRGK
jgi:uncharacterized membrane protein